MNISALKTLSVLITDNHLNQREIARNTKQSLGLVNKQLNELFSEELINSDYSLTKKAIAMMKESKPKSAIILAAGYGMRMVPINTECPKGLLTVNGEALIERLINQLHEKNITDISIIVGFMKENYDYLVDKYNVKLIYNKEYAIKNNLHSLHCAVSSIKNTYIIPCDIYSEINLFSEFELFSWYSLTERLTTNSKIKVNRKQELEFNKNIELGNYMIGISYIAQKDAPKFKENLNILCKENEYDNEFWETALFLPEPVKIGAKIIDDSKVTEINSYEQLRELDDKSKNLQTEVIDIIRKCFSCKNSDIHNIETLKKGMTNRSFLFEINQDKFIMRIPGEGTDLLINRKNEANVYEAIKSHNLCDELFYINPDNGYKISRFIPNARVCDPYDKNDLKKAMKKLRYFHDLKLKVNHSFDLFGQIDFYESLWATKKSSFRDYEETKKKVFSLKKFINSLNPEQSLTHIDAVHDNFMFSESNGSENLQLIDWEYSGMQDPHVDIAMFFIYALYDDKTYLDQLIDLYFDGSCSSSDRAKIYCYVSICGLLWSNWCEYKRQLGIEFGEYSLKQYRYAKDYYKIGISEISRINNE